MFVEFAQQVPGGGRAGGHFWARVPGPSSGTEMDYVFTLEGELGLQRAGTEEDGRRQPYFWFLQVLRD